MVKHVTVLLGDPSLPNPTTKDGKFTPEDFQSLLEIKQALSNIKGYKFHYIDNHTHLISYLLKHPPRFVFNLCDDGFYNLAEQELHIPALLEMLKIPYTGAPPPTLALCYDKALVRLIAHALGITVPIETFCSAPSQIVSVSHRYPVIVKPNFSDGSMGITQHAVSYNPEELLSYVDYLRKKMPLSPILIQEFLQGPEYTVGVIGNQEKLEVLPIFEVDYSKLPDDLPKILCFESKWVPKSVFWKKIDFKIAHLSSQKRQRLIECSLKLFKRLHCRDYARFDFRADANGNIKLLEVNPNPGLYWLSLMGGEININYSDFLKKILEIAWARYS